VDGGPIPDDAWCAQLSLADAVALVERVFRDAAAALGGEDVAAFLYEMGRSIGPPWQATLKLTAAAALAATGHPGPTAGRARAARLASPGEERKAT
jgi:hypothetical protein